MEQPSLNKDEANKEISNKDIAKEESSEINKDNLISNKPALNEDEKSIINDEPKKENRKSIEVPALNDGNQVEGNNYVDKENNLSIKMESVKSSENSSSPPTK